MSRQEALRQRDWKGYINTHDKPFRVEAFMEIIGEMTNREYWSLLADVWNGSENTHQNRRRWQRLFTSDRGEREYFMDAGERGFFATLPEKILIYRGHHRGNKIGRSWTLSKEKAEFFANRWSRPDPKVREMTINKSSAIGYLDERKEQEIVLMRAR